MTKKSVLLSWSSGKDSAWTLHMLNQSDEYQVTGLFTTINEKYDRVAMHAVRRTLLEQQAQAANLPLYVINIPYPCSNEEYAQRMTEFVDSVKTMGVEYFAFGDLYLEDIRRYREQNLEATGITPVFPLWGLNTRELARAMIENGLRAHITCVDPSKLSDEFAGREFDLSFIDSLPDNVDPCGENGEFHSFVFDGPMFSKPIHVNHGEIVKRDNFVFCDLTPV